MFMNTNKSVFAFTNNYNDITKVGKGIKCRNNKKIIEAKRTQQEASEVNAETQATGNN